MDASLLQAISTASLNLGLAWVIGGIFLQLSLANGTASWCVDALSRLRLAMLCGLVLCVASSIAVIWLQASLMGDVPLMKAGGAMWTMLGATYYGHVGLAGVFILLMLCAVQWLSRKSPDSPASPYIVVALLLSFSFTRAAVSHAADQGAVSLATFAEWLHVILIGLWVGAVAVSGWVVLPHAEVLNEVDRRTTREFLRSLSRAATIAVAGILATGSFNAYRALGSVAHLFDSTYGRILAVKLLLVALAIVLGAYNRYIGFPSVVKVESRKMLAPGSMHRIATVLRLESLILVATVIVASALALQEQPV